MQTNNEGNEPTGNVTYGLITAFIFAALLMASGLVHDSEIKAVMQLILG